MKKAFELLPDNFWKEKLEKLYSNDAFIQWVANIEKVVEKIKSEADQVRFIQSGNTKVYRYRISIACLIYDI